MQTRFRCGRIGGTFAITFALISLLGLGGSVWLVFKNSDLVSLYKPATCSFKSVKESGWVMCHYCITAYVTSIRNGKQKTVSRLRCKVSKFPCVVVQVNYTDEEGFYHEGTIQDSSSRHKFLKECSHSSCHAHPDDNKKEVDNFVMRWRDIPSRKCSYDANDPEKVIGDSNLMYTLAVQGIIWSSLVFLACVIFMASHCIYNHIKLKRKMGETVPEVRTEQPCAPAASEPFVVSEGSPRVRLCENGFHRSHQGEPQSITEEIPLSDSSESPWKPGILTEKV